MAISKDINYNTRSYINEEKSMNLTDLSASGFLKNSRNNVAWHGLLEENSVANTYNEKNLPVKLN